MAKIINGKKIVLIRGKELNQKVSAFKKKTGVTPTLLAIIVGNDPTSKLYLRLKEKAAGRVGILFEKKEFAAAAEPESIIEFIQKANLNPSVQGLMIQLPLPKKLEILDSVEPSKDVDCLTPENLGMLMMGKPRFLPAVVKAVEVVLQEVARGPFFAPRIALASRRELRLRSRGASIRGRYEGKDLKNSPRGFGGLRHKFAQKDHFTTSLKEFLKAVNIVIVGGGNLVGRPLAVHLKNLGATVTLCDEFTTNLTEHTKKADILISATGVPRLIKKEMVKKGAVVIDAGSPKGEVDFEKVKEVASVITPVPGGVGPLTVVSLLENTLLAAKPQVF